MSGLRLFRYLQPNFFAGLLDDPVMHVNVRPTGRGILLDCGQIHHLAKRVLRSLDAVFVSHAHMDHLIGFDHLLRHIHVAPRTIAVYGPAGICERIGHKLAGYDWNLAEESWCSVVVYEVRPDVIARVEFAGSRGYSPGPLESLSREGRVIYRARHLQVEAEICDHKLPVLVFRVTEARAFRVDRKRLAAENLLPGPWLKELKKRFQVGRWDEGPIEVWQAAGAGHAVKRVEDAQALYRTICCDTPPGSIGYISDMGMTQDNLDRVCDLMQGVTLLVSECTFLAEEEEKARTSAHLSTTDLNRINRMVKPECLLPMHLSKSYIRNPYRLYEELEEASGTRILRLPAYVTTRPLLPVELPALGWEGEP